MRKKTLIIFMMISMILFVSCVKKDNMNLIDESNSELIEVNLGDKELLNRSEEISDLVVELFGIDDASTIIFNNNAYVGLVLAFDHEWNQDLKDIIKYQIKEKHDDIEDVYVSNNAKIFKQINDIVYNLLQGQTYDSQVKDINKIAEKIKKER